ncbi:type II secretion system protein GspL [Celerinatantimonas sp. YJH-8]|uniref:type II secretion system protein GspL n=1 Tax=Celerinatantimonas sp. YJH-8 TaxID=3228714 RepID=UPI0038C49E0E
MKEVLLIHLGTDLSAEMDWLCWSPDTMQTVGSGVLENAQQLVHLQEMARQRQVIVLLPGQRVSVLQVPLTRTQYRQIQSHLTYLFEDQLACDPEQVHITSLDYQDGIFSAAIVDHSWMESWLQQFSQAGIAPGRWLPDYLALPNSDPSTVSLLHYRGGWLIRQQHGVSGYIDDHWLEKVLSEMSWEPSMVLVSDIPAERIDPSWQRQAMDVELPLQSLVTGALQSRVNLLHGAYRQEHASGFSWRRWRWFMASAVFVVVLAVAQLLAHSWQLQQQVKTGEQQLASLYQRVYHRQPPAAAYVQQALRQAMRHSRSSGVSHGLLSMLAHLTPVFSQFPDLKINGLNYDDSSHTMTLQVSAPSFASFEQFTKAARPMLVQSGAQSRQGDHVNATLTIKERP